MWGWRRRGVGLLVLFDKNKDKLIDMRERYQLDRELWTLHTKHKHVMVVQFDANGNGSLNPDEMIAASDAHTRYISTILAQFQLIKPKNKADPGKVRTASATP